MQYRVSTNAKPSKLAGKVEKLACKEAFDYVHSFDIHKYE